MKMSVLDSIAPQFIVDSKGKKTSVILDLKTYNSLIEELEDASDVRQAESILAAGEEEEGRTLEELEESLHKKD